jgi:hypothetical protein
MPEVKEVKTRTVLEGERPDGTKVVAVESLDPERPDWVPPFSVWVGHVFRGQCKTMENVERAFKHECERGDEAEEIAARAMSEALADVERVKWVGVEHTGGGCMVAAAYFEDTTAYLWVSDALDYDTEPGFLLCAYKGTEDAAGQPEDVIADERCPDEAALREKVVELAQSLTRKPNRRRR